MGQKCLLVSILRSHFFFIFNHFPGIGKKGEIFGEQDLPKIDYNHY